MMTHTTCFHPTSTVRTWWYSTYKQVLVIIKIYYQKNTDCSTVFFGRAFFHACVCARNGWRKDGRFWLTWATTFWTFLFNDSNRFSDIWFDWFDWFDSTDSPFAIDRAGFSQRVSYLSLTLDSGLHALASSASMHFKNLTHVVVFLVLAVE